MFTFANPWLFWFFPALVLPWIFRRRQEERIQHIDFPLLSFLRESEEKELINPQRLEILLLLLRTLLLAMLIAALAGPKWISGDSVRRSWFSYLPLGSTFQNHLVVMDNSYSMSYGQGERAWRRNAERAWESVNRGLGGFATRLVCWDRSTVRANRINRLVPLSALERDSLFATSPTEEGTSIPELLDALRETTTGAESLILITDGQRYPWKSLLEENSKARNIPPMLVVTVGEEPADNVWCEVNIVSSPPWGIAGWETIAGRVKAVLHNPSPDGTISILRSDGNETLYSRSIVFPSLPGQPVEIPFAFTTPFTDLRKSMESAGTELNLMLRVDPLDLLPLDNEIRLQLPTISSFTAGLVCPANESGPIATVLLSAINPLRETPESPPVSVERISPPDSTYRDTLGMAVLAGDLIDSWWPPEEVSTTLDYVKQGGALLVFTGGREAADGAWRQLLDILGWKWLDPESASGVPETVSLGGTGSFIRALSAWEQSMWTPWIPQRHGRLEGDSAVPVATYRIGEQTAFLLSEMSLGKGRIWVVNASLSPEEEALYSPLLPALVWETGKEAARKNSIAEIAIPGPREESNLTLLSPEEKEILTARYGFRFTTLATLEEAMKTVYGGTDLRTVLLFLCLLLALGESWLSNHLASL